MPMNSIKKSGSLRGKRVLVRASLNVPVSDGVVSDDFRLRAMLPTIDHLQKKGAKIILAGHIGRDPKRSLKPVAQYLNKHLKYTTGFAPKLYGDDLGERIDGLGNGQVLMLENLRRFPAETKNGAKFARHLASLADVYVNDAFPVSHRGHASIVGVPKHLPAYAGLRFEKEIKELTKALKPKSPFLFILGGAKFETKVPLMRKFNELADDVFVGGALANDLLRALGYEVGRSVIGDDEKTAKRFAKKKHVFEPTDVVVRTRGKDVMKPASEVKKNDKIMDAGPGSLKFLKGKENSAKLIVWNGPLGFYEKGYDGASKKLLKLIAESRAHSIIGGGDTAALVSKLGMENDFDFISTGGGAMLDYLEDGTLLGLKALQ